MSKHEVIIPEAIQWHIQRAIDKSLPDHTRQQHRYALEESVKHIQQKIALSSK